MKNISLYPPYCERLSVQKARTLSPLLFNMILEVLVSAIRQEKEKKKKTDKGKKKRTDKGEKKTYPYFSDMVVYVQNPKESTETS